MSTADAVDRETAWLATVGDTLPALLASAGGPFDVVQAYQPRTPNRRQKNLFVLRQQLHDKRFAHPRRMSDYQFLLRIWWPLSSGAGSAEADQRSLDAAVDLVLTRIAGFVGDKSHGGRFRSVAEDPAEVTVRFDDPERTMPEAVFTAEITYYADDFEVIS